MNIQEKINKKRRKLQDIKQILIEEVIMSQLKYLEYTDKQEQLENDIRRLKEQQGDKHDKIWIDVANGWKKRIYKTD